MDISFNLSPRAYNALRAFAWGLELGTLTNYMTLSPLTKKVYVWFNLKKTQEIDAKFLSTDIGSQESIPLVRAEIARESGRWPSLNEIRTYSR